MHCPVIYEAAGNHRNAAMPETFVGAAVRPSGVRSMIFCLSSKVLELLI
jgi:hypothetical protein